MLPVNLELLSGFRPILGRKVAKLTEPSGLESLQIVAGATDPTGLFLGCRMLLTRDMAASRLG
jgi:hypothetical protein